MQNVNQFEQHRAALEQCVHSGVHDAEIRQAMLRHIAAMGAAMRGRTQRGRRNADHSPDPAQRRVEPVCAGCAGVCGVIATVFLLLWSSRLYQASVAIPMANMQSCQAAISKLDDAQWISSIGDKRAICIETGLKP